MPGGPPALLVAPRAGRVRARAAPAGCTRGAAGCPQLAARAAPAGAAKAGAAAGAPAPLCLAAAAAFAVGAPLVDVGVNLGRYSPRQVGAQLARAACARVERLVLTGCSVGGSKAARRLSEEWSGTRGLGRAGRELEEPAWRELQASGVPALPALAFTAGVHPHEAAKCDGSTLGALRELASHARCVAIGECGLDYDRMFSPRPAQLEWFRRQVELAVELDKPLFLHERDRGAGKGGCLGSAADLTRILDSCGVDPSRVVVHCFTGGREALQEYVSRGYCVGLTGFVAMSGRGAHVREMVRDGLVPLDRLLLETDCPFMLPDRGRLPPELGIRRRNEPCALPAVCRAAAECLGEEPARVAWATTENAVRFFGLGGAGLDA